VGIVDGKFLDDLAGLLHPPGFGLSAPAAVRVWARAQRRFVSGHLFAMLDQ
jgi:hypothetical protein